MKNHLNVIFFLLMFGWIYPATGFATEPQDFVKGYFDALKNGDVQTIKSSLGGELYKRRKALLEKNKKYPKFLMDFYKGAELKVVGVPGSGIVHIQIRFPDGSLKQHKLVLQKDSYGKWKIIDELTFDH